LVEIGKQNKQGGIMSEIKITHSEVEITYIEGSDEWEFELRGRTRRAPSLTKAKEAIDKEPAEKRKPFPTFKAYRKRRGEFKEVTVTSLAESQSWGNEWWVNGEKYDGDKKPSRFKESERELFVITPENESMIVHIKELDGQIEKLAEQREAIYSKMEHIKPTKEMLEA
jgi:hypothetical protein